MEKKKVIIYARVSTTVQEYFRQVEELKEYADKMDYEVVKTFTEKISGAKKVEDRRATLNLLEYIEEHHVDKILIYECSRLSRRVI